jgi:hypothetical protein
MANEFGCEGDGVVIRGDDVDEHLVALGENVLHVDREIAESRTEVHGERHERRRAAGRPRHG